LIQDRSDRVFRLAELAVQQNGKKESSPGFWCICNCSGGPTGRMNNEMLPAKRGGLPRVKGVAAKQCERSMWEFRMWVTNWPRFVNPRTSTAIAPPFFWPEASAGAKAGGTHIGQHKHVPHIPPIKQ